MVQGLTFGHMAASSEPGLTPSAPGPPKELTYLEAYRLKTTGSAEEPAVEVQIGSSVQLRYSEEQQKRLRIDEEGNKLPEAPKVAPELAGLQVCGVNQASRSVDSNVAVADIDISAGLIGGGLPALAGNANTSSNAPQGAATLAANPVDADGTGSISEAQYDSMLMSLWIRCECERQMHRLAHAYYSFRHFWFMFLPATLLTLLSGILSFLSSEGTDLTVAVGCLALVATFMQSLSEQLKWSSRADMHKSASTDLKKITDDLDFQQVARIGGKSRSVSTDSYHKMYSQVMLGCKSACPLAITQAFKTIETRLFLELQPDMSNQARGDIMTTAYNELYCIITGGRLWPLVVPRPEMTVQRSINKLHWVLAEHSHDGNTLGVLFQRNRKQGQEACGDLSKVVPQDP